MKIHHKNFSYNYKHCLKEYVEARGTIVVSSLRNVAILVVDKREGEQLLKNLMSDLFRTAETASSAIR